MKISKKQKEIVIIVSVILILIAPIIIYIIAFKNLQFTDNPKDWSDFSTFYNIALGLCNLFIFYWLTNEIHKYNMNKDNENSRPILSFFKREKDLYYTVENIGLRAAIDVKIKKRNSIGNWELEKLYFTIPPGKEIKLEWTDNSQALASNYLDINNDEHFSYMEGNKLSFFKKKEIDIFKKEYDEISKPLSYVVEKVKED